ncbi:hypothetical protein RRG08_003194 [Elysia crispata]|uniref:Uncharacterized protein n=1 Tax=Elysia crispata TaxID=231223 RepID=A0AAE0XVC5_9GAST|nr:hypothetical protein RRG08_003194 [Elysia crispata]
MKNQFEHYALIKKNLNSQDVLVHIDFAENFVCKYSEQIQSVHYGASQPQISLHTGYYETVHGSKSFADVSDNINHCPESIWAFLDPVLDEIKAHYPVITTIHFFSDGPTQQYRQKKNFFLFCTHIFNKGFECGFWNFFAPGHRKGVPDGVGASVKRQGDRRVRLGADIMNAHQFVKEVGQANSDTKVFLYEIDEKSFFVVPSELKSVKKTMSLHQLYTSQKGSILYRDLSCTCLKGHGHIQHTFSAHIFPTLNQSDLNPDCSSDLSVSNDFQEMPMPVTLKVKTVPQADLATSLILESMSKVNSFQELQHECESLCLKDVYGKKRSVISTRLSVDEIAKKVLNKDFKCQKQHFSVRVRADGNCLPACGAVFAFGEDIKPQDIRLLIIQELVLHKSYYLDEQNLKRGYDLPCKDNELIKAFAQYSDHFIPGQKLNAEPIKQLYEREVMDLCRDKSYMGIWQMFALATVLKMPIRSCYPSLGISCPTLVRKHLNRLILPRIQVSNDEAAIMWTSTRTDMLPYNWVPNHFVPILPFS